MDRFKNLTDITNNSIEPGNFKQYPSSTENLIDLPPEYCSYRDEGCELYSSCLKCPYPKCVLDLPSGSVSLRKHLRDEAIRESYQQSRLSVSELARCFMVHPRTVTRALDSNPGRSPGISQTRKENTPEPPFVDLK